MVRVLSPAGTAPYRESGMEHYLYAGEAGRRQDYARWLLQRDGRYRRQSGEAFDEYVRLYRDTRKLRSIAASGASLTYARDATAFCSAGSDEKVRLRLMQVGMLARRVSEAAR